MHSVRIELARLILAGTRITYQATGDAGICTWYLVYHTSNLQMRELRDTNIKYSSIKLSNDQSNVYEIHPNGMTCTLTLFSVYRTWYIHTSKYVVYVRTEIYFEYKVNNTRSININIKILDYVP